VLAGRDALAIALYVEIDDFLEPRRGPGRPPRLSDGYGYSARTAASSGAPGSTPAAPPTGCRSASSSRRPTPRARGRQGDARTRPPGRPHGDRRRASPEPTLKAGWRTGAPTSYPDREDEPYRHAPLGQVRQWIESVFWTCKGQLGLERHGATHPPRPRRPHRGAPTRARRRHLAQPQHPPTEWRATSTRGPGAPISVAVVGWPIPAEKRLPARRTERAGRRGNGLGAGTSRKRLKGLEPSTFCMASRP
jgi:hypothetical protein